MENKKVTIITPSFNQAQYLEETILSVINQQYKNIEYIIIDGGSNDSSIEIIKKYEKNITYWVSEKDRGQADAINKGFAKATGDYICWVNSDDLLYPSFISDRLMQFEKYKDVSIIYGDVHQGWNINNKILRRGKQQSWNEMITSGIVQVPQMSAIWKKEVYDFIGGLDITLSVLLDWEYFVRIAQNFKIKYISGSVAFFRQHKDSKSVNLNSKWVDEMLLYYKKNIFENALKNKNELIKTKQNLYLYCSKLYKEVNAIHDVNKFLTMAKEVSPVRFFRILIYNKLIYFLINIKKHLKK